MYFQILGSGAATLPAGWGDEKVLSFFSSSRIDATASPAADAQLRVIAILSSTTVTVSPGTRVELSGGDIVGSHSVDVESDAAGPLIRIRAVPLLSSIKIRSI